MTGRRNTNRKSFLELTSVSASIANVSARLGARMLTLRPKFRPGCQNIGPDLDNGLNGLISVSTMSSRIWPQS